MSSYAWNEYTDILKRSNSIDWSNQRIDFLLDLINGKKRRPPSAEKKLPFTKLHLFSRIKINQRSKHTSVSLERELQIEICLMRVVFENVAQCGRTFQMYDLNGHSQIIFKRLCRIAYRLCICVCVCFCFTQYNSVLNELNTSCFWFRYIDKQLAFDTDEPRGSYYTIQRYLFKQDEKKHGVHKHHIFVHIFIGCGVGNEAILFFVLRFQRS